MMLYEYDASHDKCPLPLVKTRVLLKKMDKGDCCLLTLKDKGSLQDIPKLLSKLGYTFSEKKLVSGVVEILIKNR